MVKKKTSLNVYILLDRSASMENLWKEAVGSINGYVGELDEDTNVILALFDTISYDVIRNSTVKTWKKVGTNEFSPRGGTPLFDSVARMMWRIEDDKPEKAVFVVMTDGEENQSRFFNQSAVKSMANNLTQKLGYEVIFLGANFDKVGDTAKSFNLGNDKWVNLSAQGMNDYMTGSLAVATRSYGSGASAAINITDKDKATAIKG